MFAIQKIFAFVVLAVVGSVAAQVADCDRTYVVSSGDTCDGISAAQNVSTYQLATVNKDKIDPLCDNLAVDEPLCLGITGEDCSTVAVIKTGDSCGVITDAAGIPLSTLLANNPNINADCSNIYPGEVLCTSSTIFVNSTTSA